MEMEPLRSGKRKREEEDDQVDSQGPQNKVPKTKEKKKKVTKQRKANKRRQQKAKLPDALASRYCVGAKLGQGGFGTVYEGTRISDGLQVAIKVISKWRNTVPYIQSTDGSQPVPLEVALMQMVSQPSTDHVVRLMDWADEPRRYVLVLERPHPCVDLDAFLNSFGGSLSEDLARDIMVQAVEAARQCQLQGVVHRDIKPENFLINTDTLQLKLIDFGCGDWIRRTGYNEFSGTWQYFPPEFYLSGWYHGHHVTVWSLGVLLYRLVSGVLPFNDVPDISQGLLYFGDGLSTGHGRRRCEETFSSNA